ncbi:MAG TPA: hypothetical protein VGI40_26100 [Pirellulaceae bacterium]
MRFRLRTLLIVLAVGPPALAWAWVNYPRPVPAKTWEKITRELEAALAATEHLSVGPPFCGSCEE